MAFVVYTPRSDSYVAVSKNHITLNKNLVAKLNSDHVELAYDRDKKVIRVTAVNDSGLLLNNTRIGAKGFLMYFGIDTKGKFPAEYNENDKCIYIELK